MRDLPRDPVVITWPFYCRLHRLDPCLGTKILHDLRPKVKKKERKFLEWNKNENITYHLKKKIKKKKKNKDWSLSFPLVKKGLI